MTDRFASIGVKPQTMDQDTSTDDPRASVFAGPAEGEETRLLELTLSDRGATFLSDLEADTGQPAEEVIRKALGLYRLAVDAWKEGKRVGTVSSPESLESEFIGD